MKFLLWIPGMALQTSSLVLLCCLWRIYGGGRVVTAQVVMHVCFCEQVCSSVGASSFFSFYLIRSLRLPQFFLHAQQVQSYRSTLLCLFITFITCYFILQISLCCFFLADTISQIQTVFPIELFLWWGKKAFYPKRAIVQLELVKVSDWNDECWGWLLETLLWKRLCSRAGLQEACSRWLSASCRHFYDLFTAYFINTTWFHQIK